MKNNYLWWQKDILYQIYPRSYKDSTGNGVGDLKGIVQKLDYLKDLGIKGVWLSPVFPSPMKDFGYDVSNYTGIDSLFGDMEDFHVLLNEVHNRELKLLLDFVPNHSSNEHPWFLESRSSLNNPKRNWYIWKDPAEDGGPPNNWQSVFGGSAWEYDSTTGQYYYHAFLKEQPDLNWREPQVQEAMFKAMRFWLDKGVDGFRVDVMWHMIKDNRFRDNPVNTNYSEKDSPYHQYEPFYTTNRPEVHEIVRKMRKVIDEYTERVMIGEIYLPVKQLVAYYGKDHDEAHLPFNFQLITSPWNAENTGEIIKQYEELLHPGDWPNWVLGNHDNSRIASRAGKNQARIAAMLLFTLRGTPTMYYGDEIGMTDVTIPEDKIQDPQEKNIPGKGLGRDPERTPMQWDRSTNAGFSTGEPWLPLMDDFKIVNVESQLENNDSLLSWYKDLIRLRNKTRTLQTGDYIHVAAKGDLLAYKRIDATENYLILLNFCGKEIRFDDDLNLSGTSEIVFSTHKERQGKNITFPIVLQPHQGIIIRINT